MWKAVIVILAGAMIICLSIALYRTTATEERKASITDKVYLIFFGDPNPEINQTYAFDDAILIVKHAKFNPRRKTVLYIHGFNDIINGTAVPAIAKAYTTYRDYNFIILNYNELVHTNYFTEAIPDIIELAPLMAALIIDWFFDGLDLLKFHIVGFSLGANMAGHIGRSIHEQTNGRIIIRRITGLEPAGPGFYGPFGAQPLNYTDADFVDTIHTTPFILSYIFPTGHVNFWPNGGRFQPGCTFDRTGNRTDSYKCTHGRVWSLWAESLNPANEFLAVAAESWTDFKEGNVNRSNVILMGEDATKGTDANYYLTTNDVSPFSRAAKGTYYHKEDEKNETIVY